MRKLFERTVRTAVTMKLVDLAVQAVDGTKVGANAAGDRTYDAEELSRLLDRVEKAIADLEAQNEAGEDAAVANLPEELANKESPAGTGASGNERTCQSRRLQAHQP